MPARRWFVPGIRGKLFGFLLPLVCLLIGAAAYSASRITDASVRRDLLERGAGISRILSVSAGYSLLSGDRLALDRLTAELSGGTSDVEYVAIVDKEGIVLAHSVLGESGRPFPPREGEEGTLGTVGDTKAAELVLLGKPLIEFTTPILFSGVQVGTVYLGVKKDSLLNAQREVRRTVVAVAAALLVLAVGGTLVLASWITTPVKRLFSGVQELAAGESFHAIPVRGRDELAELTRSFNRMAETILTQRDHLSRYARELEREYVGTVRVLAASIDARDPYTLGHSARVSWLSCQLGRRLGFGEEELEHLERACLFHDVGKIRTPDEILLKEEFLSPQEMLIMRRHPEDGAAILQMAPSLHRYVPVVRYHHEWYNGKGYPEGKRDSEIPLHAQIISVADAFDAMTSSRPYRRAKTFEEAAQEILRFRGSQFSPFVTDAFVRMVGDLPPMEREDWRASLP